MQFIKLESPSSDSELWDRLFKVHCDKNYHLTLCLLTKSHVAISKIRFVTMAACFAQTFFSMNEPKKEF